MRWSDAGRLDRPHGLELEPGAVEVVEEAGAAAEQDRHEVRLHLVEQAGGEVLLDRVGAAAE